MIVVRKNRVILAVIASFYCFGSLNPALAQTQAVSGGFGSFLTGVIENFIVDPRKWLQAIWCSVGTDDPKCEVRSDQGTLLFEVKGINVGKYIQIFAGALLLLGILWSGLRIVTLGGTVELQGFLVRALIAGALVFSGPWMGQLLRDEWITCYKWSHENISKPATDRAIEELKLLSVTMAAISVTYIGSPIIIEVAKAAAGKNVEQATKDAKAGVAGNANTILQLVSYVVGSIAAIVTVEYVVVILSGFAIIIASLLIPLSGVLLIFPGNALQSWFSTWLKGASAAILIVLLHPIAYAAALELGFTQPAVNFNTTLTRAGDQLKSSYDKLTNLIPNGNITEAPGYIKNLFSNATGSITDLAGAAGTVLFGTVTSIVMLFIGIAFAVIFVYAAQTQIMAFIGSIVGGGAGKGGNAFAGLATAGGVLAGNAASAAGFAGGGAGSSSSTPGGGSSSGGGNGGGGGGGDGSSPGGGGGRRSGESNSDYSDRMQDEQSQWSSAQNEADLADFDSRLASSGGGSSGGAASGAGQAGGAAAEGLTAEEAAAVLLL